MSDDPVLPDPELVTDELFARGVDAVMNEPRLADLRERLSERDIRRLVAVIVSETSTIAARLVIASLRSEHPIPLGPAA